ncbi:Uncharacterised protein [Vibrio cholerae]|uniref:Uncharacterized protein n=1 Tax=Vibrio cholerae TaxID=666 RepID=A0A655WKA1_VIBCL|nr:Uncharacterised protein [Vibrio cholerae]CSA48062.1 Uncharacterised protein [Vibrio cholerae]CSB01400.1 Uncharacterised protein [Vibrio cholerae]CSB92804.1 Uncharacterised protein [Vibrio cholerae]CSC02998.1 Uncharacterised protein [Vibrio cholerae]
MILLGNIGQVQELVKGASHGSQLVVRKIFDLFDQQLAVCLVARSGRFGKFSDGFHFR